MGGRSTSTRWKAALKLETRAVFVQANETSTGARHDVKALGQLLKDAKSEALLIVDGITGLGTSDLDMDAWGIDVLIGGGGGGGGADSAGTELSCGEHARVGPDGGDVQSAVLL